MADRDLSFIEAAHSSQSNRELTERFLENEFETKSLDLGTESRKIEVGTQSALLTPLKLAGAMYSPELLDHFQNPRNAGEIEDPDAQARVENPVCGDILEVSMKLDGDKIADIRFLAKGCVPSMACGSAITELAKGKTIAEARGIRREELIQKLAGVPEASTHAAQLAIDALSALLRKAEGRPGS